MYIVKDSYADKIIVALSFSGTFDYNSLEMIDSNKVMLQRNARKLKKEGYIGITGKGKDKSIRLKEKGRNVLEQRYPSLYHFYMYNTDGGFVRSGKGNETEMWRKHRQAEMMLILYKAGVYFLDTQKPKVFSRMQESKVSLPDYASFLYLSKELKNLDENLKAKVYFTRTLGMLASSQNFYALYNTNEGLMMWHNYGESKAKQMFNSIVNSSFKLEERFNCNSSIIFGKNMNVAYKILNSKRGKKDAKGFEFLSFDNTYYNMHFLTLDSYGIMQTKLLTIKDIDKKISSLLFPSSQIVNKNTSSIDCEAIDRDNNIVKVEFITGNIGKIKRLLNFMSIDKKFSYKIYAFDYQLDFLKKYLPKNVLYETIDPGYIYMNFLNEGGLK